MFSALVIENTSAVTPHLARLLDAAGVSFRIVSDHEGEVAGHRLVSLDLTDEDALAEAMEGAGVVFNMVDYRLFRRSERERMWLSSIGEVRSACAAALRSGVRTFAYLSSVETIGHPSSSLVADADSSFLPDDSRTSYGRCKFRQESEVQQAVEQGLRAFCLCVGETAPIRPLGGFRGWLARRLGFAPCGVRPVSDPVGVASELLRLAQEEAEGKRLFVSRNEPVGRAMTGRDDFFGLGRTATRLLCGFSADEAAYWTACQTFSTKAEEMEKETC